MMRMTTVYQDNRHPLRISKRGLLEVTGFEKGGRTRLGVTHCLESEQLEDFDPAKTAGTRSARAMEQLSAG